MNSKWKVLLAGIVAAAVMAAAAAAVGAWQFRQINRMHAGRLLGTADALLVQIFNERIRHIETISAAIASNPGFVAYMAAALETDAATGEIFIRRTDGSTIPLPTLRNQVEIEKTYVSADGKRIGWLVDEPNCCTSYPVPLHLVIFKGGRIEKTFEEDQCIFDWAFAKKGTAVSYWTSVLHGSDYQNFLLRDIASGKRLARYFYPDSFDGGNEGGEARREAAIAAAPRWVKDTPSH